MLLASFKTALDHDGRRRRRSVYGGLRARRSGFTEIFMKFCSHGEEISFSEQSVSSIIFFYTRSHPNRGMAAVCKRKQDWFQFLFGFEEQTGRSAAYLHTQSQFSFDAASGTLTSNANGRSFAAGQFSTPILSVCLAQYASFV